MIDIELSARSQSDEQSQSLTSWSFLFREQGLHLGHVFPDDLPQCLAHGRRIVYVF